MSELELEVSTLDALKKEATELGIGYSPNIGEAKLQEKVDAFYAQQESVPVIVETKELKKTGWSDTDRRKLARDREVAARKTRVVEIIDNDQRINNQSTSCTVNCSNTMFDLGTVVLPLGMPVEVMQGHIDVLKSVDIPHHTRRKDGLAETTLRKRYSISYLDNK